jgi:hypothetical protein
MEATPARLAIGALSQRTGCQVETIRYYERIGLLPAPGRSAGRYRLYAPPHLYGIVPTYQPAHFGRVYAAYGGVFILLSLLWGWAVDRLALDRFDVIGAIICLVGVAVIMYWPR